MLDKTRGFELKLRLGISPHLKAAAFSEAVQGSGVGTNKQASSSSFTPQP